MRKIEVDEIIECYKLLNDDIDFSKFEYTNNYTKSIVNCGKHGEFKLTIKQIRNNIPCPGCSDKILSTDVFVKKSEKIHSYDYSVTNYVNSRTKVQINCLKHGLFELYPSQHIRYKQGCPGCKIDKNRDEFIKMANDAHNNFYSYDSINYINNKTPISIKCPNHGEFYQRPDNHISNLNGCPSCNKSKGEEVIIKYFKLNNIEFQFQKKFIGCSYKSDLRFDFYLPKFNTCVEFNGIQHYQPVKIFGGEDTLKYNVIRDDIKRKFCDSNNIGIYIIKYDDDILSMLNLFRDVYINPKLKEA